MAGPGIRGYSLYTTFVPLGKGNPVMTIAACTPRFTLPAASKAAGLISILSHVMINRSFITVLLAGSRATMEDVYRNASRHGLEVVSKRPGVAAIWKGDTLYGV